MRGRTVGHETAVLFVRYRTSERGFGGLRLSVKDPDQRSNVVSSERIEATGFNPIVDLDTGIDELVKGYAIVRRNQFANV
jgi:hypothetical protein